MFVVLAHGALGYWDEAILFVIVAIFLGFTVVSWFKNRQAPTETSDQISSTSTDKQQMNNQADKNHFELD